MVSVITDVGVLESGFLRELGTAKGQKEGSGERSGY